MRRMVRSFAIMLACLAIGACGDLVPDGRGGSAPRSASAPVAVSNSPEARQCLAELGATDAAFTPLPDKYAGQGCTLLNTVSLNSVAGDFDALGVTNLGPVACPTASAFAAWARYGVDRAARQVLGSPVARIETMGSYSCRNVAGTGRLSAHATAEAIDVAGFVLADGRRVSVLGDWDQGTSAEREFLRIVQRSACKRFGTVLGPQYNAAHRDHFHLERGGDGGFCR